MPPSSINPQHRAGESVASPRIVPLAPDHAATAARLHIDGQPGTFLTSLGPGVLTVLYSAMAQSKVGFGFAAASANATPVHSSVSGFISATTSVGGLFVEMGTRRLGTLLPALLARYAQRPSLALRSVQTVLYPFLVSENDAEDEREHQASAELLSIMVEPALRGQGVGAHLLAALVAECRARQITRLDVTVDTVNDGARRFYARHGFAFHHDFTLYGRPMCLYQLNISDCREDAR